MAAKFNEQQNKCVWSCDSEHPGRAAVFLQPWDNKSRNDHMKQSEQEGNILNGTRRLSWEAVMAARQTLAAPRFSGCRSPNWGPGASSWENQQVQDNLGIFSELEEGIWRCCIPGSQLVKPSHKLLFSCFWVWRCCGSWLAAWETPVVVIRVHGLV